MKNWLMRQRSESNRKEPGRILRMSAIFMAAVALLALGLSLARPMHLRALAGPTAIPPAPLKGPFLSKDEAAAEIRARNKEIYGESVAQYIRHMSDPDAEVRAAAAIALGKAQDDTAIDVLGQHLMSDLDARVRYECALALGIIRGVRAERYLLQGALDQHEIVRLNSARSLARIGEQRLSTKVLKQMLSHEARGMRQLAIDGLADVGTPASVDLIKSMLSDREPIIVITAAQRLVDLGQYDIAYTTFLRYLGPRSSWIGDADPTMNNEGTVRSAALVGLRDIGDERSIRVLRKTLGDEDPNIATRASFLLRSLGPETTPEVKWQTPK